MRSRGAVADRAAGIRAATLRLRNCACFSRIQLDIFTRTVRDSAADRLTIGAFSHHSRVTIQRISPQGAKVPKLITKPNAGFFAPFFSWRLCVYAFLFQLRTPRTTPVPVRDYPPTPPRHRKRGCNLRRGASFATPRLCPAKPLIHFWRTPLYRPLRVEGLVRMLGRSLRAPVLFRERLRPRQFRCSTRCSRRFFLVSRRAVVDIM